MQKGKSLECGSGMVFTERLSCKTLESMGFSSINPDAFHLLFRGSDLFICNISDQLIVKYSKEGDHRVYDFSGPGPGELLKPYRMFSLKDQVVVHDLQKRHLLYFDTDLNLQNEIQIAALPIRKITATHTGQFSVFGDFEDGTMFAIMNADFETLKSRGNRKREKPFENIFPHTLYMGYMIDGSVVADTSWGHYNRICRIRILDLWKEKPLVVLEWPNPYDINQKSVNRHEGYSSRYVCWDGNYYYSQNTYSKGIDRRSIRSSKSDLIVFDMDGQLIRRYPDTPRDIIYADYSSPEKREIWFMNRNGDMDSGKFRHY